MAPIPQLQASPEAQGSEGGSCTLGLLLVLWLFYRDSLGSREGANGAFPRVRPPTQSRKGTRTPLPASPRPQRTLEIRLKGGAGGDAGVWAAAASRPVEAQAQRNVTRKAPQGTKEAQEGQ